MSLGGVVVWWRGLLFVFWRFLVINSDFEILFTGVVSKSKMMMLTLVNV